MKLSTLATSPSCQKILPVARPTLLTMVLVAASAATAACGSSSSEWEAGDADALVALLSDELIAVMPPTPMWFRRASFEAFFRLRIGPGLRRDGARMVRCDANGQPAFGLYRGGKLSAVHVVTARRGRIAVIDHFVLPVLFSVFGLAPSLS